MDGNLQRDSIVYKTALLFDNTLLQHRRTISTFLCIYHRRTNMSSSSKTTRAPPKSRQELANARKVINKLQADAFAGLPIGGLFIVLFVRADPHQKDSFHWAFYHHFSPVRGHKYHITGERGRWIAGHGPASGTFSSYTLSVIIKIGQIPQASNTLLDKIMRSHDHELNSLLPAITCRVWVTRIVEKLVADDMVSLSGTLKALEDECTTFGNQLSDGEGQKRQPRPVVQSTICS